MIYKVNRFWTVVKNREVDKSYEVYMAIYQGLTGHEENSNIFKQFSRDFFDLIIIGFIIEKILTVM